MYKKSITLILAIVALILLIGCSKQPQKETPKEEKTLMGIEGRIRKTY